MNIGPARPEDALGIARVHVRSWQAAYASILAAEYLDQLSIDERALRWLTILQSAESHTLVAHRSDACLGFVSFAHCRDEGASQEKGEIWAMYTEPEIWGQGVGQALLSRATQELQALGRHDISLWVLCDNHRGIRFYQAFGFAAVAGSGKLLELGGRQVEEVCFRLRFDAKQAIESE